MTTAHRLLSVTALLIILMMLGLSSQATAQVNERLPEPRYPQDLEEARARFEQAREALNRSRYEQAAELFAESFELSRPELLAGDALYWEAFALARLERTSALKRAIARLRLQQEEYPAVETAREREALASRIYALLAERGEADAAREVAERATEEQLRQETRTAALQALMQMDPRKAMPLLKKIVKDRSPENQELRNNAVFIMCRNSDTETVDLLIDLLRTETDPEFVSQVVMCLSTVSSERSRQALMDLFRDTDDPEVAEVALLSIGRQGGDQVFGFLQEVARDQSRPTEIRGQALMAMSMAGRDKEVAQALVEVLNTEKDQDILEMAVVSLGRLDDPVAEQALGAILDNPEADEELKAMALHFAVQNNDVDPALLRDLYDKAESRDLKRQVCHVLTMLDDQDTALDMLIEIARTETDPEIKRDAVFWIGQFDSERAAEYLMDVINGK